MKKILAFIIPWVSLFGTHTDECAPFDADLYRKDVRVFHADAEFLWWMVQEGALQYALQQTSPLPANTSVGAHGKYKRQEYDWHPGFRVSLGYYKGTDFWDAFIQYTWFYSSGEDKTSNPSDPNLFANGTWNQTIQPISAKSSVWLHHHLGNFLVARVFVPNPHLRLRLYGGLTGGWIDQEWDVFYRDQNGESIKITNDWRFWGVGPRVGVSFDWYWFWNVYFTGRVSFGGLLGKYHNNAFEKLVIADTSLLNTRYSDYRFVFNPQYILGFSWQKSFCSSRVEVFAGYEMNQWFNLQEVYRSTFANREFGHEPRINTGEITFHGLTARLTVDF